MMYVAFAIISTIYGLINYYIGTRFIAIIKHYFSLKTSLLVFIPIILLALSSLINYIVPKVNWRFIGTLGTYWFGIAAISLVIFGLTDISLFIINLFRKTQISSTALITVRLINIGIILVLFIVGVITAKSLKTTQYNISINKSSSLDSLKVAMFSDLHLGYINSQNDVQKIVDEINKMNADIVLIPGDFFDGNINAVQDPEKIVEILSQLKSTYGTYLSWGNHDAGSSFDEMKSFLSTANITILEDDIHEFSDSFILVGRRDSSPIGNQGERRTSIDETLKNHNTKLPIIVMDHQPSNIDQYNQADLILSGHTHKGQVFPGNLMTNAIFTVDYGHYSNDNIQAIVTSGAGTWGPPIRIGSKSEIVEINISFN